MIAGFEPASEMSVPSDPEAAVCGRLAELRQAITRCATEFEADVLTAPEARGVVADCNAIEASVAAVRALAAVRAAAAETWKASGYRSAAEELAAGSGTSTGAARQTLDTGRRLASNRKVARAALSGELSPAQAALVGNGAEAAPDKTDDLLEKARTSSLSELADEVARTKAAASDPEERRAAIHDGRWLRAWTDPEGVWHLFAEGLPDDGARLHIVVGEIRRALIAARRQKGITGETFQALDYDSLLTLVRVALGTEAELSLADLYRQGLFPGLDDLLGDVDAPPERASWAPQASPAAGTTPDGRSDAAAASLTTGEPPADTPAPATGTSRGEDPTAPDASPPDVPRRDAPRRDAPRRDASPLDTSPAVAASVVASTTPTSPEGDPAGESTPGTYPNPKPWPTTLFEQAGGLPAERCEGPSGEDQLHAPTRPGDAASASASTRPSSSGTRLPKRRRARPISAQIQVRVDLDALMRGVPVEGELCEIVGYGPVPVSVVEDLVANDAAFIVAILTKAKRVAGVAHFGRAPNAYQDSALSFMYPRCAAAGCNNRVFLQRDHREDWARTHVTVLDWMDRLCTHHHRLKTTRGWALVAGRGKPAFVPPDDHRHPRHRPTEDAPHDPEGVGRGHSPPLAGTG